MGRVEVTELGIQGLNKMHKNQGEQCKYFQNTTFGQTEPRRIFELMTVRSIPLSPTLMLHSAAIIWCKTLCVEVKITNYVLWSRTDFTLNKYFSLQNLHSCSILSTKLQIVFKVSPLQWNVI